MRQLGEDQIIIKDSQSLKQRLKKCLSKYVVSFRKYRSRGIHMSLLYTLRCSDDHFRNCAVLGSFYALNLEKILA